MIQTTRGVLLDSNAAIVALGKVYVPIGKDNYWFIKTLDKVQRALKREGKISNKESNRLIGEFGKLQEAGPQAGRKAIQQTDVEAMEKYSDAMEVNNAVPVSIDVKQITLTQLKEAQVSLQANDQVSLMWLFSEE
jgi:hypothetical protein